MLAAQHNVEEMCKIIGADSLSYISLDGMYQAVSGVNRENDKGVTYCDACFSGDYPIAINK